MKQVYATLTSQSDHLLLYAAMAAVLVMVISQVPYVGRVLRAGISFALLSLCIYVLIQQAPFQPGLARLAEGLGIDGQTVSGNQVRVKKATDGHFWVDAEVNGVRRRMLVDSGATITAISDRTAAAAAVQDGAGLLPVIIQTANGVTQARTGTVDRLRIGQIEARNLKVVISPALGPIDILGMNFLSQLKSWRIDEGRTLILVPRAPDDSPGAGS